MSATPPPSACCGHHHEEGESEEVLEQKALGKIIFALRQYAHCLEQEVQRWEHNYSALSARHRALLHHLPGKAAAARRAMQQNQLFIKAMLYNFAGTNGPEPGAEAGEQQQQQQQPYEQQGAGMPDDLYTGAVQAADAMQAAGAKCSPIDAEKVRYVLKNLVRDWSAEGQLERQESYGRIIQELKARFTDWQGSEPPRVLLPGAGLGRLCVEVAAAGFEAQGNEFSYFMLIAAAFMLNASAVEQQWTIYPWVHLTCNNISDTDQLRAVCIPDVVPGNVVPPGLLSMCAGDFVEVYARPEYKSSFDAVVTCFFIDTAHNIIEYLEVIHRVLQAGGMWIHLGPLLWHWADAGWDELSIELSLADVQHIAQLMGFDLLQEQFVEAAYMANMHSMYKTVYQAAFWTMRKSDRQLPIDLTELVQLLARSKPQQQAAQQHTQQLATAAAAARAGAQQAAQPHQTQPQLEPQVQVPRACSQQQHGEGQPRGDLGCKQHSMPDAPKEQNQGPS